MMASVIKIWVIQSRPTFDLSEVGLRQQSQYNAQLEHRDWRCFFRPFFFWYVGHNRFTQRDVPFLLTDFHFPDTIFRGCGWIMELKHVEHVYEVKYSLSCQSKRIAYAFSLNCFPPRLAWPFRQEPSHVPAIPIHIIVVIGAMASVFALPETNRRSALAIDLACGY
jgi:hypothetical protein